MLKHVGRYDNKRVVIIFRQIPDEDHMALVIYPDKLPSNNHDDIMKVLESPEGQQSKNLGEALYRRLGSDGENILTTIHKNKWLKKVQTQGVILQPNAKSQVRLDEINKIISDLEAGGEAAQRMAEIDARRGLRDPEKTKGIPDYTQGQKDASKLTGDPSLLKAESTDAVIDISEIHSAEDLAASFLDNTVLGQAQLKQADNMDAESRGLAAEAVRLREEAYGLNPELRPKRGPGRPKKA